MLELSDRSQTLTREKAQKGLVPFTDVCTGSTLGLGTTTYPTTATDFILDLAAHNVTLLPHTGPRGLQYFYLGALQPAFSAAQAHMPEGGTTWRLFSALGARTILVGDFPTPKRESVEDVDTIQTTLVSPVSIRSDAPSVEIKVRELFGDLVARWKETRNAHSSGVEMFTHPAYQSIIGMGEKVLPLIFQELRRELDHWFWALKAITRCDPVPPAALGNLIEMRKYWLEWATTNGYRWHTNSTNTRDTGRNSHR